MKTVSLWWETERNFLTPLLVFLLLLLLCLAFPLHLLPLVFLPIQFARIVAKCVFLFLFLFVFKNASYNKALLKQIQSYIIFPVVDFQCTCIWFVWALREMLDIFCLCTFFIFIFAYHYIFSFISSVFFLFFSVVDHCSQYQSMESLLRCLCSLILHTGVYVLSQSPMFSPRERQCVLASVIKI